MGDPSQNGVSRGLCDFELNGSLSLLLQNQRLRCRGLTVADVAHLQLHETHARSLLSIAKLKRASSRHRLATCKRTRIAQISLSLNGVFWPTSLPLFQGSRVVVVNALVSIIGPFCWGATILQFFEKT
jgi:hypothetical protein